MGHTDNNDIKKFAESMDVNVIQRPKSLSADETKTEDVVRHFLKKVNTDKGPKLPELKLPKLKKIEI